MVLAATPENEALQTSRSAQFFVVPNASYRAEIGRGRSGVVYLDRATNGTKIASKVFESHGLTKFAQCILMGAPNPYIWNLNAVRCAELRRNVLRFLVPYWTAGNVCVAEAYCVVRNDVLNTYELRTRYVQGRPSLLPHSLNSAGTDESRNLWRNVLPVLREHLQLAGFGGLLWQAGIGNPVALNNFLYEENTLSGAPNGGNGAADPGHWVWIDLESGVPAVFPVSPKVFFSYSVAKWWKLGRPPFDDVNIDGLMAYLAATEQDLRAEFGDKNLQLLLTYAAELGTAQKQWKAVGRIQSSIEYSLHKGKLDNASADYYRQRPVRWAVRQASSLCLSGIRRALQAAQSALRWPFHVDYATLLHAAGSFISSQTYREQFVRDYLSSRIEVWSHRGQISNSQVKQLLGKLERLDSSGYVTDFGIHVAIKPAVKIMQYWVFPLMFVAGILSGTSLAVLLVTGGAIGRSAYTLGRLMQSIGRNQERPWVALTVGVFPVVGNLAYPIQMLYSMRGHDQILARFLLDDGFAILGQHFPIWGGQDTWTEHVFVRIAGYTTGSWTR